MMGRVLVMRLVILMFLLYTPHDVLKHPFQVFQQASSQPQIKHMLSMAHWVRHPRHDPRFSLLCFRKFILLRG